MLSITNSRTALNALFPFGVSTARVRVSRNGTRVLTLLVKVKAPVAFGSL